MKKLLLTKIAFIFLQSTFAQYTFETIQKHGIHFKVGPEFQIEEGKEKNGESSKLFGKNSYKVTLVDFSFLPIPNDIEYKGKKYYYNEFFGQLQPYFNATRVISANMIVMVDGLKDCKEFGDNYKPGTSKALFCEPLQGKRVSITGFKLKDVTVSGVEELQRKIDDLEREAREKEKKDKVTNLLREAVDLLNDKEFTAAINKFKEVLTIDPQNEEAKEGKDKALQLANDAKNEEQKKQAIAKLNYQAQDFIASNNYESAIKAYKEILKIDPSNGEAIAAIESAQIDIKKKIEQQKKDDNKKNKLIDDIKNAEEKKRRADIETAANKKYWDSKWREDSIFYAEQRKSKEKEKIETHELNRELTDNYEKNLNSAFVKAKKQFSYLSAEEQQKACELAEGYAANAELFIQMKDFNNACKFFQRAALTCPTHPKAEFNWLINSVVDFGSSLSSNEAEKEKQEKARSQKQSLQLMEALTTYSNNPIYNLYNKYQIEQGYKQLYEQAKSDANQYYNTFSKISDVDVKFTDLTSLNSFINTRIKMIDDNYLKSMKAAGIKAGAEFDQTYAQTGSINTAATTGVISGATDMLANALAANGAKKLLRQEREGQIYKIGQEFVLKLYDNIKISLQKMLKGKTALDDEGAFSEFLYYFNKANYACYNFSYSNNSWFYTNDFSIDSEVKDFKSIPFIENNSDIKAAQRKIYFAKRLDKIKGLNCNSLSISTTLYPGSRTFINEAEAWLSNVVKENPSSANAYYLLSQIEDYWPKYYNYAFTAAQLAKNDKLHHFTGYTEKTQKLFKNYLLKLVASYNANNYNEWKDILRYKLYNQLPKEELGALILNLITNQQTIYLRSFIQSDKVFQSKEFLQGLMLDAIRLNKGNITQMLKSFIDNTTIVELNKTQINFLQLSIIENKDLAFAGLVNKDENFIVCADKMKAFENNYSADNLYRCFATAALRYDIIAPLEYIRQVNADYLSIHTEISDSAISWSGKTKVLTWLSEQKFLSTKKLNSKLYDVSVFNYNDLVTLLNLGADVNVKLPNQNSVLYEQLKKMYNNFVKLNNKYIGEGNKIDKKYFSRWKQTFDNFYKPFIALLLEYKADVFALANEGYVTFHNVNNSIIRSENGASDKNSSFSHIPNRPSTVFHVAAGLGDIQIMKRLLLAANETPDKQKTLKLINMQDGNGETPLHIAVYNNYSAIASLLINAGADDKIKNKEGVTAKQLAKKYDINIMPFKDMGERDILNFILEEEYLDIISLNKRAHPVDAISLQTKYSLNSNFSTAYVEFSKKIFNSEADLTTTNYFRSEEFLNAVKSRIVNQTLKASVGYSDIDFWKVQSDREIKNLNFISIVYENYNYRMRFSITLSDAILEKTNCTATLDIVFSYNEQTRKLEFSSSSNFWLFDVKLSKTINPDETAVFYKPKAFMPAEYKIDRTDFATFYSKKISNVNDILQKYITWNENYEYRDVKIKNFQTPVSDYKWDFVLIRNKENRPIIVTAVFNR